MERGSTMKRALLTAYLLLLHAVVVVALVETDLLPQAAVRLGLRDAAPETDPMIPAMRAIHARTDAQVPEGATLFVGDSHTMSLATAAVAPLAVNYGIGSQRSDQLLETMPLYRSMSRAAAVVITIGTNDLLQGRAAGIGERYRRLLAAVPPGRAIVLSSVPPIARPVAWGRQFEPADVRPLVDAARAACKAVPRCTFVDAYAALTDAGAPRAGVLLDDGVHLSVLGYEAWAQALRSALGSRAIP
jgi:lysophospholipase L1-like esterase